MNEALIAVQIFLMAASRIQSIIETAQSAGRELTPEELAQVKTEQELAKAKQTEVGARVTNLLESIIASDKATTTLSSPAV